MTACGPGSRELTMPTVELPLAAPLQGHAQWIGDGSRRALNNRKLKRNRFVGFMKLALPLAALVLIALIIAWPQLYQKYENINLSWASVEIIDRQLRMANPRYQGIDNRGQPYLVTADSAVQDSKDQKIVTLDNIHADTKAEDGSWATLTAKSGIYTEIDKLLLLAGDVSVYSDRGYEFHSPTAICDLDTGEVTSDDPVNGQGPTGTLRANSFWLADKGSHMRFVGSVKMRLYPQSGG